MKETTVAFMVAVMIFGGVAIWVKLPKKMVATPEKVTTAVAEATATRSPTTTKPAPTVEQRCVIVVDGKKYDVSSFRNQHSGGDVFDCGTDMSNIFHQQHSNSFLKTMEQYRI